MGAVFLQGALLAGLVAVVVPLAIHLLSRRRARRVRFAPIEFVLRSQKRTARSVRLRQLLLLLLRTLLLAALAVALARPVWRDKPAPAATTAPLAVVLVVDATASMTATLDGKSAFLRAKDTASQLVRELTDDVRLGLVLCADEPQDLVAVPTFDRGAVLAALDAAVVTHRAGVLAPCIARAAVIARSVAANAAAPGAPAGERRVVVVSDLVAHALRGGLDGSGASSGEGLTLEWRRAGQDGAGNGFGAPEQVPNHGIQRVDVTRAAKGDAVLVQFTAARYGKSAGDVSADLIVDGARAARLSLPLEDARPLERAFTLPLTAELLKDALSAPNAGGLLDARVVLADDALAADNVAFVPLRMPVPVRVVLVDGAPQPVPFRDEVFYLQSALSQAKSAEGNLLVEVITPEQVNAEALAGARVVVLANVGRVADDAVTAVRELAQSGGGVLFTMGDQVDVDWMNQAFGELLPGALRGQKGTALLDDAAVAEVLSLQRFNVTHPLLQSLARGNGDELLGLQRVRTHTLMLLEPDADAPREVLARFSNDAPALIERSVAGDGRVLLLATSVDRDWSDLAIRPGFLPLMQQTVLYLARALDDTGPRVIPVGAPRTLKLPRGAEALVVTDPQGKSTRLTPEASAPRGPGFGVPARSGDDVGSDVVRYDDTDVPGLYRVAVVQPGGEPRLLAAEAFGVILDARESDLTLATPDQLTQAAPVGATVRGEEGDGDDPLWPFLLLSLVLWLLLEAAVLRRSAL